MPVEAAVLVTGGAGFIGSHLCERLLEMGKTVVSLDSFDDYYDPLIKEKNIEKALDCPDYNLYGGDIRDSSLLESIFNTFNIQEIIHLAALAGVRNSLLNPLEYIDVDIKGTVNLLEHAKKYSVRRFLFASSSSVYGHNPVPFREQDRVDTPVSPYAAAKRAGELYCRVYHDLYNLSIGCLRFFTVYGPRQRPEMAIHLFTRHIDLGLKVPVFGPGTSQRDYTYIDDIVDGILKALASSYSFEVFNFGNSYPIGLMDLIQLIAEEVGKKPKISFLPAQPGDVPKTYADISYAQKTIGYNPQISLPEGIKRFVQWYRKQRHQVQ
ncbi:MAG: GDP-mannose 4,6-dehydratase [Syntrophomonadaceae bacterium]|nr:GDP-mannose 4,6-dehydratase [Syntrophomonadaceae bacterium]